MNMEGFGNLCIDIISKFSEIKNFERVKSTKILLKYYTISEKKRKIKVLFEMWKKKAKKPVARNSRNTKLSLSGPFKSRSFFSTSLK